MLSETSGACSLGSITFLGCCDAALCQPALIVLVIAADSDLESDRINCFLVGMGPGNTMHPGLVPLAV